MSDCKAYRHELLEACDGGEMSRAAGAHLATCAPCGEELRQRENLRTLVGGLGKVEAPPDFEFRLRARMAAAKTPARRAPLRGLRLLYTFAPVAAAACFLVVSTALYLRQASQKAPAAARSESARNAEPANAEGTPPDPGAFGSDAPAVGRAASDTPAPAQVAPALHASTSNAPRTPHRLRAASGRTRVFAARPGGQGRLAPNTTLAGFGSAPVITGRNVPFALRARAEPLRMVLRDERGAGRVVPLRAVSFGAQEMLARESATFGATVAKDEGVW